MTKIFLMGLIGIGFLAGPAAAANDMRKSTGTATTAEHGQPEGADIAVLVNGMVCSFCAQGITKKFSEMEEVQAVDVRMADSRVYITTKKGYELDDAKIKKTFDYAGYTVEKIDRVPAPPPIK